MSSRPIIVNKTEAQQLSAGTKRQFCKPVRLTKPWQSVSRSTLEEFFTPGELNWTRITAEIPYICHPNMDVCAPKRTRLYCPYGKPGDELWIREPWVLEDTSEYHGDHTIPTDSRPILKLDSDDDLLVERSCWHIPHYRAVDVDPHIVPYPAVLDHPDDDRTRWNQSASMPRWVARMAVEITSIRITYLQWLTEEDAALAGFQAHAPGLCTEDPDKYSGCYSAKTALLRDWDSRQGKRRALLSENNPLVWVIGTTPKYDLCSTERTLEDE